MVPYRCLQRIILFYLLLFFQANYSPLIIYFPHIWDSWPPSKVIVFFLQVLLNRFSYRENLFKKKLILDPSFTVCPICGVFVESASHLFVTDDLASNA